MIVEKPMVLTKEDGITVDRYGKSEYYSTEGYFRVSAGEKIRLDVGGKKQFERTVPKNKENFIVVKITITEDTFWKHGTYQGANIKGE